MSINLNYYRFLTYDKLSDLFYNWDYFFFIFSILGIALYCLAGIHDIKKAYTSKSEDYIKRISCILPFVTDDACQSFLPRDTDKAYYTSINQTLSPVSK